MHIYYICSRCIVYRLQSLHASYLQLTNMNYELSASFERNYYYEKENSYLQFLALSAAFFWSLPAFAKEFTSDSVLTIDTPDDNWAQIKMMRRARNLTNGKILL